MAKDFRGSMKDEGFGFPKQGISFPTEGYGKRRCSAKFPPNGQSHVRNSEKSAILTSDNKSNCDQNRFSCDGIEINFVDFHKTN